MEICKWQMKSFVYSQRLMGVSWVEEYAIMLPPGDFSVAHCRYLRLLETELVTTC